MLIYLDSLIVIYFLDHVGSFQVRAANRISAAATAGDLFAISDLTRFECRVGPIRARNAQRLADFEGFFLQPDVRLVPLPGTVFDLAAVIRADYGFKAADSIHLAAAVESGCDLFLTNDSQLRRFTGIAIEILP
jgi:predicted nucleic acid-binding protein